MKKFSENSGGFTLIELIFVIVIIAILSAVAIPKMGDIISGSKENVTKQNMLNIKQAIIGDAGARVGGVVVDAGYKGNLGYRPAQLEDLVTKPGSDPVYNQWTRMGWNGPYISDDGSGSYKLDGWGNSLVLTDNAIVSMGPDGIFGNSDDISLRY